MPSRRILIFLLFAPLVAYLGWTFYIHSGIHARGLAYGLALAATASLAALTAVWSMLRASHPRARAAWLCFTLGLLLAAANGVYQYEQLIGISFDFNIEDLLRVAALLFFAAGLQFLPRARRHISAALLLMDMVVVAAAALVISWSLILRPLWQAYPTWTLMVYPSVALFVLVQVFILFLDSDVPGQTVSLAYIELALLLIAGAALSDSFLLRRGTEISISLVNMSWLLSSTLFGLAAVNRIQPGSKPAHLPAWVFRPTLRLQPLLPLILTALVCWQILVSWVIDAQFFPSGPMLAGILGLIVYARYQINVEEREIRPYASLVNSVAEPAFVCDQSGALVLVNPALLGATGYPVQDDLLKRPLAEILDPNAPIAVMLNQALARGIDPNDTRPIGWSGETALQRRDGSLIPVYLSLRPILTQPDASGPSRPQLSLAGTAHDLTWQRKQQAALEQAYRQIEAARAQLQALNTDLERKVAEETENLNQANRQLEAQNRKLQMLDRLKSDFVSLVSHELRSPLTNINGGIELVLSRPGPLEPRVRGNLELVQAEILRLTRFVETILDLSALDAGRLPLYLAPVSFESVVASLQTSLVHLPGAERVRWQSPGRLPFLLADERALSSVLFHLLDNALKYAPQGEILIEAVQDGNGVCISVRDNGPGIYPDALPMLFDRFYRLNTEDSQTVYGHGLGLYIVRRLMEAMGGQVEAGNRPEGGAAFSCWLQLAPTAEIEEENEPKDPSGR